MVDTSRFTRQKPRCACSPVVIFGTGLIIVQLAIFRIGLSVFHASNDINHNDGKTPAKISVQSFQQTRRKKPKRKTYSDATADGKFNGYPIHFKETKGVHTLPHCVGENYQEGKSWMHRSCRFDFFCFDTDIKEFVVFESPDDEKLYTHLEQRPFVDVSQSYMKKSTNQSNTVSLGGINLKWTMKDEGIPRLEWFPEIRTKTADDILSYYELPRDIVMVPFHSMNGANPGHLVWDDFLPIYTLLTMFQLEEQSDLLMMRYVLKGRGLWASCDFKDEKREACKHMHKKFLPLMMGLEPIHSLTTTEDFDFEVKGDVKSSLVCSRQGLAGMGAITDHGPSKMHGWEEADYKTTHNHGRGGMLYDFRNYMMSNLGLPVEFDQKPPFRIVFSEKSSDIPSRYIDFSTQMDVLRRTFNPKYVSVESYVLKDLSLVEQVEIASRASIFITGCGGGAVTATFLPKGSSVLLYYVEDGGLKNGRETGKPARLDWDLFNNLGYLKVHWLPKTTMRSEVDLRSLVLLVQHELDGLMRERSYDRFFGSVDKL
jgi:hypothetical protein